MCCPGREYFLQLARGGHWGFQVQCVSRFWKLIVKNGDGLEEGAEGAHRRNESSVVHCNLLSSL